MSMLEEDVALMRQFINLNNLVEGLKDLNLKVVSFEEEDDDLIRPLQAMDKEVDCLKQQHFFRHNSMLSRTSRPSPRVRHKRSTQNRQDISSASSSRSSSGVSCSEIRCNDSGSSLGSDICGGFSAKSSGVQHESQNSHDSGIQLSQSDDKDVFFV
ncbi:unnamed protein product [Soboliphyme baturini]|uniref:CCDC107 n=1 Tax=Soboliphyme baturini TaxID=241478 RepID=A0A183IM96_9BILA|nr:unnamed protein product [Soboliphyme baturini]